jgi:tRNA(fMet)-specific endonuclease VapC
MSEKYPATHARMVECSLSENLYVPSIVLFELEYGNAKSLFRAKSALRLKRFLQEPVVILDFRHEDAEAAGRIRATLEARKEPIGPFDTLIAGQALARNLTLVTANHREFARIDGLQWEDWS